MARKKKGALAVKPGDYNLTEQQQARFDQLKSTQGRKRAQKFLRRQDRRGNLTPAGQPLPGEAPVETMPEPTVEPTPQEVAQQSYQESQGAVNQGVTQQIEQLNTRPAFQPTGLPEIPTDFMAARQKASDAAYQAATRRLDDRFGREEEAMRQRLYEQGVPEGSEKYQRLMNDFRENKNAAYQDAQNQAYLTGQSEQALAFNQASGARGQLYGEALQNYRNPLEQLQAYSPYYQTGAAGQRLQEQLNYQTGAREDTQQFTSEQSQLDFERQKQLAKQQQRYALQQIAATPRGGGGGGSGIMPFDEWARRQDYAAQIQQNQTFDNAVIGGFGNAPQYLPGYGSGLSQGIGAGVGAVVGGALR